MLLVVVVVRMADEPHCGPIVVAAVVVGVRMADEPHCGPIVVAAVVAVRTAAETHRQPDSC